MTIAATKEMSTHIIISEKDYHTLKSARQRPRVYQRKDLQIKSKKIREIFEEFVDEDDVMQTKLYTRLCFLKTLHRSLYRKFFNCQV